MLFIFRVAKRKTIKRSVIESDPDESETEEKVHQVAILILKYMKTLIIHPRKFHHGLYKSQF